MAENMTDEYRAESLAAELMEAVDANDEDEVREILNSAGDMEAVKRVVNLPIKGESAVTRACMKGHAGVLKVLIDSGGDVNSNYCATTCLMYATIPEQHECIELLLDYDADVNSTDTLGQTAATLSLKNKTTDCLKELLANGANVDHKDIYGISLLTEAVTNGYLQHAEVLIQNGAGVNSTDFSGLSALHWAASLGKERSVKFLCANGADTNLRTNRGETPLIIALRENRHSSKLAEILIENGAAVNSTEFTGLSALHWAASLGKEKSVKFLCENGADTNIQSNKGETPLVEAIKENHHSCIRLMLEFGADAKIPSHEDWTPLIYAASKDAETLTLILDSFKENPQFKYKGNSALVRAIETSKSANVRLLIQNGVPVKNIGKSDFDAQIWGRLRDIRHVNLCIAAGVEITAFENHFAYPKGIDHFFYDRLENLSICTNSNLKNGTNVTTTTAATERPSSVVATTVTSTCVYDLDQNTISPIDLQWLIRDALRRHLLDVHPETNLYHSVKDLPLPEPVKEFLLFNVQLEEES